MKILPDDTPALLSFRDLVRAGVIGSRSALGRAIAERGFPRPIKTSDNTARYVRAEVEAWLEERR